ncbi:PadR family transcriptional regulator [Methanobrevibacter sp. OttesenSCG-928-K11]|nr:PadR family transcriptional regulator [Methanobrevibacter sp. OttesenSCG-928-K11]MDL2270455.1 PadR family transcriptional regulator [Methanobrevibacter sp. OttesenSCG-928-I08]
MEELTNSNNSCNDFLLEFNEKFDLKFKMISKQFINGLHRLLILWIINKNRIHGYGIMKCLDNFFEEFIENDILSKSNSSKIYPILHEMEENEIIFGEWDLNNNKKVKFYTITPKGRLLLQNAKLKHKKLLSTDLWTDFLHDMGIKIIED